jgi:hypothetical protein
MDREKQKLYRKVNTKAKGVSHHFGGQFNETRNSRKETVQQVKGTMFGTKQRGLDYTPLFKFLLSKVGSNWNDVYKEAKSRLDKQDPIFWLVALSEAEKNDYVRIGESTYYSGLFVDDNNVLQLVNQNLKSTDLTPLCNCCTHTFNGKLFGTE